MGPAKKSQKDFGTPGDQYLWTMGDRSRLEFTLNYVGVMLFMMVIITYRFTGLPVGDNNNNNKHH